MVSLYTFSLLLSATTVAVLATPVVEPASHALHAQSDAYILRASRHDGFGPTRNHPNRRKRANAPKRCSARPGSSSLLSSSSSAAPTTAPGGVGAAPQTTTPTPTTTTSEKPATTSTKSGNGGGGGGGGSNGGGNKGGGAGKPAHWPSVTQSGPTYSQTAASPSDPYLKSISQALNNKGVPDYNKEQTGDLTYYQTGQVACGDFYTDDTFTAAVSHKLWHAWPGSGPEVNTDRAAICGPWVPGREILNGAGTYSPAISSPLGKVIIGGDGLPNCQSGVGLTGQCHIPLTATITNPANGKSAVVKIVDQCAGCAGHGDIDVTPTVFAYLSDINLGRTTVTWRFNHF